MVSQNKKPQKAALNRIFYCAETGLFTRFHLQRKKVVAVKSKPTAKGYSRFKVGKRCFMAHVVAFFIMTGRLPREIDHINGNRLDNRWANLRECTRNLNCVNRFGSKPGLRGFVLAPKARKRKYRAQIRAWGVNHGLGAYLTPEKAGRIYEKALFFVENDDKSGFLAFKKSLNVKIGRPPNAAKTS